MPCRAQPHCGVMWSPPCSQAVGWGCLQDGGVWSEAGVPTPLGLDGPPSSACRKHEVTVSGFDFVGVGLREHLEFEKGRTRRITSHEVTVLA